MRRHNTKYKRKAQGRGVKKTLLKRKGIKELNCKIHCKHLTEKKKETHSASIYLLQCVKSVQNYQSMKTSEQYR